ncbi:MAG: nucleotidyl transferase AbiEii/AbiGii toxin family protein [Deltaproteobacteria bacterium]|nr:nucleotidyl transferase AbiEii/AbiGii toxin family protein [Deltaproteobacteria bacterium]
MTVRTYTSPAGFKQALETRLRADAVLTGRALGRQRQLVVFDRFLARIAAELGDRVIVKGGVVLELRLARARTTRDIDLRVIGDPTTLEAQLRAAAARDLGDHLVFEVRADPTHPTIEGEGIVYEGRRFRAAARLAGKPYGDPFGVDAGFADRLIDEPELLTGSTALAFAGVAASRHRVYPRESHIAEKLHAFTLPRSRENTRVKDLPDLALLAQTGPFDGPRLRAALEATFGFRGTHPLPVAVPTPPVAWAAPYARIAGSDMLPWVTIEEVTDAVREFLDPVLFGTTQTWDAEEWRWR